ncbi:TPD52 protein, partial [Atractosteus spatula]|nr:TPD52 protein [Atractosteus spatula]
MDFSSTETPEDYKSPFNFERGVNTNYLYLSPSDSVTPPGSPVFSAKGASRPEPIPEVGEDAVSTVSLSAPALTEEEQEELRAELAKVEDEIQTLSQVLAAKEKHVAEIKRKLGISPLNELKQNITKGWQDVTASTAYKKTSETLSQAGQKATAAFSSVGSAITKKLEDVRNSPTFKSFEEKVETLKTKVSSQPPTGDFGEVLNSAASASATDAKPEETPVESQGSH